jgi:peptidoglycan-associated lipoprotein
MKPVKPSISIASLLALALLAALVAAGTGCRTGNAIEPTSGTVPPAPERVEREPGLDGPMGGEVEELDAEGFAEEDLDFEDRFAEEEVEAEDATVEELNEQGVLETVYFAFDSAELSDQSLRTIEQNAEWLEEHPDYHVVVEGHTDERGTTEYNLSLGARRAKAVREHLVRLGVDGERVRTISYGEERPRETGSGETAWAANRRGEFRLVEP